MHGGRHRDLLERFYVEIPESSGTADLAEVVHEDVHVSDVAFEGAHEGREAYAEHLERLWTAFADPEATYEVYAASGGTITVEYAVTAVHEGPSMGVPATGNEVTIRGIDVLTLDDGRISRIRTAFDLFGLRSDMDAGAVARE